MHVELATTPSGRETVEINFGGRIEVLSPEDALKLADWIIELCRPATPAQDLAETSALIEKTVKELASASGIPASLLNTGRSISFTCPNCGTFVGIDWGKEDS